MLKDKEALPCFKPDLYFLELIVGSGFSRSKARKIYNSLLSNIMNALTDGERVRIGGFGSFHIQQRKARPAPGRPPLPADTPQKNFIQFRPARPFRLIADQLNQPEPLQTTSTDSISLQNSLSPSIEPVPTESNALRFEHHYNIGIAYKEMSLFEPAIKELENAAQLVGPEDEDHRFIHCCSLLGNCYVAAGNYPEAERWLLSGLKLSNKKSSEYIALRYELGLVYEAWEKLDNATEAFSEVYSIDQNFRRVVEKLKSLQMSYVSSQSPKRSERRKQLIPVVVRGCDSSGIDFQEEMLIVNISRRGAGLRTSRSLKPGSIIQLYFANVERLKTAKVIWCSPADSSEEGFQAGVIVYN
jgi:nucleoid DNA-binding protein